MMVTISVAPALANDDRDDHLLRRDIQLDRQILHELRNDDLGCCGFNRFDHEVCCDDLAFISSPFAFGFGFGCWQLEPDGEWDWEC